MARNTKIKDVKIIRTGLDNVEEEQNNFVKVGTENCIPKNRDAILLYADEPCVAACQLLYDLNIQTFSSGAHVDGEENKEGIGFIGIIYDTLSDQNKKIVLDMIASGIIPPLTNGEGRGYGLVFNLEVKIKSDSLVGDVSDQLLALASYFKPQDVLYGRMTKEEMQSSYFVKIDENKYLDNLTYGMVTYDEMNVLLPQYVAYQCENMYSDDGETYFISEDLLQKHLKYIAKEEIHTLK